MNEVTVVLFALIAWVAANVIMDFIYQQYCCRKAQFDCEFCKYWPCQAHRCRHELKKRGKCVWGEEEKRCDVCADRNCCTAANSGVLFPCPYFKLVTQEHETVAPIGTAAEE